MPSTCLPPAQTGDAQPVALGLDLGGTKAEAQLFDSHWRVIARRRVATPGDYPALVAAIAGLIGWGRAQAGGPLPTGISAAGRVHPGTGLALTANLAATGHPFPADIARAAGQPVAFLNDGQALTLSEAALGVARGRGTVASLIIGSGIGGGVAIDGGLTEGPGGFGGEIGHVAIAAAPVVTHGLPLLRCGCGRTGCYETLIAGPGMERLALHLTGRALTAPEVAALRESDADAARIWSVWCELVAELVVMLTLTLDPDCIVLAGGLSRIEGLVPALTGSAARVMLPGWPLPDLCLAEAGDASGARGAGYAALQGFAMTPVTTTPTTVEAP